MTFLHTHNLLGRMWGFHRYYQVSKAQNGGWGQAFGGGWLFMLSFWCAPQTGKWICGLEQQITEKWRLFYSLCCSRQYALLTFVFLFCKGVAVKMSSWLSLGICSRKSLICCFLFRVPILATIATGCFVSLSVKKYNMGQSGCVCVCVCR